MAFLLSASEAALRFGEGRSGFRCAVRDGAIRSRADGPRCFWPEEVDLAVLNRRAGASPIAPLLALAQGLASLTEDADIAETTARHVHLLTGASDAALYALDANPPRLRRLPRRARPPFERDVVIGKDELPAWDDLVAGRQTLLVADAAADPRLAPELAVRLGLTSLVAVPLIAGGEVGGAMIVDGWPDDALPEPPSLQLLTGMADLVAVALARAAQSASERRRLRHATALNALAAALDPIESVGELVPVLTNQTAAALTAGRVGVYLYDGRADAVSRWLCAEDGRAVPDERPAAMPPRAVPAERAMLVSGRPIMDRALLRASSGDSRAHAALAPLTAGGAVLGALWVYRSAGQSAFDGDELALLTAIGERGGAVLARAHRLADARAAQARSERRLGTREVILATNRQFAISPDLAATLTAIGDGVNHLLPNSGRAIYRVDPDGRALRRVYASSLGSASDAAERLPTHRGLVGAVLRAGRPLALAHAERDPRTSLDAFEPAVRRFIDRHGLRLIAVPLAVDAVSLGILVVLRIGGTPFSDDDLAMVHAYASQAAVTLHAAETLIGAKELHLACVRALASAVDAKDPSTRGHSTRVSHVARAIASALGLDRSTVETVELAALLHDIGKVGVPDGILLKPGQLDDAERAVMMGHAALGAQILAEVGGDALAPLVPLVRHHHEWENGAGYPDHLRGDAIPLGAAIIAVADAFDTLVTDRGYRAGCRPAAAIAELRAAGGSQFRPRVVAALADLLDRDPLARPTATAVPPVAGSLPLGAPELNPITARALVTAGQLGDTRALGLLMELGSMTRHIPDLREFLQHVTEMIRRRLGYDDVMLMLVDHARRELSIATHSGDDPPERLAHYRQSLDVGICGEVARTGRPRNVIDVTVEPGFHADWPNPEGSELVIPLTIDGKTIGVINVESRRVAAFSAADEEVLTAAAGQIAAAVHVAQLHDAVKRMAMTDGLTGLANHRAFYEALDAATAAEPRLSIVLLDVEGLKVVNDSAGHLAGDALLRRVATFVRGCVGAADVVARYGGDEFAIILRDTGFTEATRIAADIRDRLTAGERAASCTTVRYGVASLPRDGWRSVDLVDVADHRLYQMRAAQAQRP